VDTDISRHGNHNVPSLFGWKNLVAKKSGKGGIGSCPYCEEFLEFVDSEVVSFEITETYKCPSCGRRFSIRFTPESWAEI